MSHWVSLYGTPLTITFDQSTQFESALFTSLTKLIGASRIRTAPYHPQFNGLVERMHRTFKAALMCSDQTPWPDLLPTVLLGLRTSFKEDLQASLAEMLCGTTLRVPGKFFVMGSTPAVPCNFVGKLRSLFQVVKTVKASRHAQQRPFSFRELHSCSHVFKKMKSVRKPLETPYTGPHEVVRRINDRNFVIQINGVEKTVSTDSLKPTYLKSQDATPPPTTSPSCQSPQTPAKTSIISAPITPSLVIGPKRVSFSSPADEVTGEKVTVTPRAGPRCAARPSGRRKQALVAHPWC